MAYNGAWLWHADIRLALVEEERKCSSCGQPGTVFRLFALGEQFVQYCCPLETSCAQRAGNKLTRMLIRHGREVGVCSLVGNGPGDCRNPGLARNYIRDILLPRADMVVREMLMNGRGADRRCRGCYSVPPTKEISVSVMHTRLSVDVCNSCLLHERSNLKRQARALVAQEMRNFWYEGVTIHLAIHCRFGH